MTNRSALLAGTAITAAGFVFLAALHGSTNLVGFLPGWSLSGGCHHLCGALRQSHHRRGPPKYFGPVTSSRTTIGQFFFAIGFSISTVAIDKLTSGEPCTGCRRLGCRRRKPARDSTR